MITPAVSTADRWTRAQDDIAEWNVPVTSEQETWRREEVARWLAAEVCEIDETHEVGIIHPLLLVDKEGWQSQPTPELQWEKKFRLCLAVKKWVNESLPRHRLRMETLTMAVRSIWPGDMLSKGDLKSGYNHLLLREGCRRFWRFRLDGVVYRMRALFFGLATAPYVFSLCMMQMIRHLRDQGARMSFFIDDVIMAEPPTLLQQRLHRWLWPVSGVLGMFWGSKSEWEVSEMKVHLGSVVDSQKRQLRLRPERAKQLRDAARYLLKRGEITVRTILRIVGRLRAFQGAIPNGQLLCWELAKQVASLVSSRIPNPQDLSPRKLKALWRPILKHRLTLDKGAIRALEWVKSRATSTLGRKWHDDDTMRLVVDAGPQRAGGIMDGKKMSMDYPTWMREHLTNRQSLRELVALWLGAQTFVAQLEGERVILENDCQGALAALRSLHNGSLAPWVAEVLWYFMDHGIELHRTHWVPGRELIRRGVDGLSRIVDVNDWKLNEQTWAMVWNWNRGLQIDRFASGDNAQLRRWNSRFHEPGTEGVDALQQLWRGSVNYACPPLSMLSQVVEPIRSQEADTTLILPVWPNQPWWPLVRILSPNPSQWLTLGWSNDLFSTGTSGSGAVFRHHWKFVAVRLFPTM
jgi:hypothetical protein